MARYLSIWFRHLSADWLTLKRPVLDGQPFVFATKERNRKIVTALNRQATGAGISRGMTVAEARLLIPSLTVIDDFGGKETELLTRIGLWCLRYTPVVALAGQDGIVLDTSGCTHLWGGEGPYLKEIVLKIRGRGFNARGAIADTPGAAWAWARYGEQHPIIAPGQLTQALCPLPVPALHLEEHTIQRLRKLGLTTIGDLLRQPRQALLLRFGHELKGRLEQILGEQEEQLSPLVPPPVYQERLTALDPIVTATGIEIALTQLLDKITTLLDKEGKGLRRAVFTIHRLDGSRQALTVGTIRPSANPRYLFKLFEPSIETLAPRSGIEVFTLDATIVEPAPPKQEALWGTGGGVDSPSFAELLDRLVNKPGVTAVNRYLPSEHHSPERSFAPARNLGDTSPSPWPDKLWPVHLLTPPAPIDVLVPIPDYPPKQFKYMGEYHEIVRADGPLRLENEWWLEEKGAHDYYRVEDSDGKRYCLFRSGNYNTPTTPIRWYLLGFFG